GAELGPGRARVGRAVDPDAAAERQPGVAGVARAGVDGRGIAGVQRHRPHRQRRHGVRRRPPGAAAVAGRPDPAVIRRDVDHAVPPAPGVERDAGDLARVGTRSLARLQARRDAQRRRADRRPLRDDGARPGVVGEGGEWEREDQCDRCEEPGAHAADIVHEGAMPQRPPADVAGQRMWRTRSAATSGSTPPGPTGLAASGGPKKFTDKTIPSAVLNWTKRTLPAASVLNRYRAPSMVRTTPFGAAGISRG